MIHSQGVPSSLDGESRVVRRTTTIAVRNIKAKRALAGPSVPQAHRQPSPGTPRSKINCHSTVSGRVTAPLLQARDSPDGQLVQASRCLRQHTVRPRLRRRSEHLRRRVGVGVTRWAGIAPASLPENHFASTLRYRRKRFRERAELGMLKDKNCGVGELARQLGGDPATISRELRRNAHAERTAGVAAPGRTVTPIHRSGQGLRTSPYRPPFQGPVGHYEINFRFSAGSRCWILRVRGQGIATPVGRRRIGRW